MAALASQPTTAAVAPTGAACFKCGKRGHWSRDCAASKEDQDLHRAAKEAADAALASGLPAAGPPPAKRSRKVTLEDLKAAEGLPELYATLPSRFRRLASGRRGEEGPDLARLVDLYAAWGRRLAPALAFPALLDSLEALGRTGAVKLELRELRAQALAPLERVGTENADEGGGAGLVGGWLGGGAGPAATTTVRPASPPPAFIGGGGGADADDEAAAAAFDDLDDEELMELQAAPAAPAAPAAAPPAAAPPAATVPVPEGDDEDALVALFEGASQEAAAEAVGGPLPPQPPAPRAAEGPRQEQPAPGATAAPPKLPTLSMAEEEEALVALFASQVEAE